jgi:ribosome-associated toxin RatA of RatAB toxin-antitoxin module
MLADTRTHRDRGTGGRVGARRFCVVAALAALAAVAASAAESQPASVTVHEEGGVYRVAASFLTPQSRAIAQDVLTDYEAIPRFMPDVQRSRIVERRATSIVVEQEAVARVLFFSKKIHLELEVHTEPGRIGFRDRSGQSFTRYEGTWTLAERDGQAAVTYELLAQPAFDVPGFLLTRLLKRDADRMIGRLLAEMAVRAAAAPRR